ncbi:MAG: peptidoglycan-binding protein, partial [Patescibacteria group bacterium]|nr:peptidoglycan-binding protein [Patescibacteria group bacterium]
YSWLVVDGFEIRNSQPFTNVNQMAYSGGITWGGSAPGSGNITIKDNYIHNLTVDGIYIRGRWDLAQSDQVPANFDIADNTIEWTNGHGIFVRWGVNNAVIEGNMIDLSGVDFEHSGGDIAADNIFLEGGANQGGGSMQYNNVIRNNILKKSEESLGYPVNKSNVFISDQNNLNIYGNLFTGQPQVANMDDAGIIQGMNVFNNVFTGSIYTFQGPISFHTDQGATTPFSNIKILDNTFVDSPASGGGDLGFNIGVGTNITILNNIIDGNPESGNFAKFGYQINVLFNTGIVDYTTLQINNNVYNSAMTTPFYLNGSYYKLSGWKPALQSLGVSGYDSNSSYGAASFVDRSGGDFHLASNDTLARGQGINLSAYCSSIPALCTDKDGKPRPSTGPWDIGAYQYSSTPINNNPPSPIPTDSPTPTPSATPVTSSSSGSAPTPPTTSGGVTVASAGGGIVGGGGTVGGGGGGGGASITTGANSGASNSPATNSPTKPCTSSSSTIPASALSLTIGTRGQAVINLQTFLVITGYLQRQYITGYFGPLTKASLTSYQSAHPSNTCASTTLQPSHPTTLPQFTRSLKLGMIGNDVKNLQIFLNTHGFTVSQSGPGSSGHETTYFGPATFRALIRFQNAYANQILAPYGLSQGTGFFGPSTIKEANSLI